jgi:hypothetical protein
MTACAGRHHVIQTPNPKGNSPASTQTGRIPMPRPLREITRCARELTPSSNGRHASGCAWFVSVQRSRSTLRHHPHRRAKAKAAHKNNTGHTRRLTWLAEPVALQGTRTTARPFRLLSGPPAVRLLVDRGRSVPSSAAFSPIPLHSASGGGTRQRRGRTATVPHARFCSMTFHGLKHRTKAKYSEAPERRKPEHPPLLTAPFNDRHARCFPHQRQEQLYSKPPLMPAPASRTPGIGSPPFPPRPTTALQRPGSLSITPSCLRHGSRGLACRLQETPAPAADAPISLRHLDCPSTHSAAGVVWRVRRPQKELETKTDHHVADGKTD